MQDKQTVQGLSLEQLAYRAPAILGDSPWQDRSKRYRFIKTCDIVEDLRRNGFYPVKVQQSKTRIQGKEKCCKHMIRFRLSGYDSPTLLDEVIPEIILINSHDGTSAYKLLFGMYRLVCLNGLVVASAQFSTIKAIHSGRINMAEDIIEKSKRIIDQAPAVIDQVKLWQSIAIDKQDQAQMAQAALEYNRSNLSIDPGELLRARRSADFCDPVTGRRSLWQTYNVIQENIIKGGMSGRSENGRLLAVRAVNNIDRNIFINRALWNIAEQTAGIKQQQFINEGRV